MAKGGKQPVLKIGGDARGATKAMTTVRTGLTRMKDVAKRVGATMKTVLMAPFKALKLGFGILGRLKYHLMGLIALGGLSIRASIKQKLSMRQLEMAVDAAGYSWDEWGGKIIKCLNSLQKITNFGDEETAIMFKELLLAGMKPKKLIEDMPRILDLCTAAGYDMATGAEYIARAWTGEYSILKRNIPLIAGLMKAQDARKKALGRELTQVEEWNMLMGMSASKFANLAVETRRLNPFPALLGEINDNLEEMGDFLDDYILPPVRKLTAFFEKTKTLNFGVLFKTLRDELTKPAWWDKFGEFLHALVSDNIASGFRAGMIRGAGFGWEKLGIKKVAMMKWGVEIGLGKGKHMLGTAMRGLAVGAGIRVPGEPTPYERPPMPTKTWPYNMMSRWAMEEATGSWQQRLDELRALGAPGKKAITAGLAKEGELTHAELMRRFLMNQTTAQHRGQLAQII